MNLLCNKNYLKALEFIATHDIAAMETGRHDIDGDNLYVNVCESQLKTVAQARFEAHREYIDLQLPLSGPESYGIMPVGDCVDQDGEFDTGKDIVFYNDPIAEGTVFTAQPGQVVLFTPGDAHAPLIGNGTIRKAIFKIKVSE